VCSSDLSKVVPHYGGDSLYLIRARKSGFKIFVYNHFSIFNLYGESNTAPKSWLLKDGKPEDIIKLILNPYSVCNWRIWLAINQEEYGKIIGTLSFLVYYKTRFITPIILITILRFFTLSLRYKILSMKQNIFAKKKLENLISEK
jgi:hypothetical protein